MSVRCWCWMNGLRNILWKKGMDFDAEKVYGTAGFCCGCEVDVCFIKSVV